MKKLVFGLMAIFMLICTSYGVNPLKKDNCIINNETMSELGRCRTWNVTLGAGVISASTSVTLCCYANNWRFPPIICYELRAINNQEVTTGNLYQYIMIDEIEKNLKTKIDVDAITISSNEINDIDGKNYSIKSGTYLIEENERKERFVKIILEPKA